MNESISKFHPADPLSVVRRLRTIPRKPGVYLMKDQASHVIYIGKAKNLRNRIRSYFSGGDGRLSIPFLVSRVRNIDTIVTEDEQQAIVLEADLIKKHQPRYNVRLKDDRAYLVVRIDMKHDWPRIELVRQVKDDGAKYIGPFAYSHELRRLLEIVRQSVPLRTCSDTTLINRVRPCLEYQIKRCCAPCCLEVDRAQYLGWIRQAIGILEGRNKEVLVQLAAQMEKASDELRYEEAARIRDRMETLKQVIQEKPILTFRPGSKDSFAICRSDGNVELSVLNVRNGRLFGARSFGFSDVEIPNEELLASLMTQYYAEHDLPDEVLIPFDLEDIQARSELYSNRAGRKVEISVPLRGNRVRLLDLAQENANENFAARFGLAELGDPGARSLQSQLDLSQRPRTIECVDISHFQGGATVASVVSFKDGQPDKSRYRHFSLTQQEGKPDDFASMHEVVLRHLSRSAQENTLPDLMVIDGGVGQLNKALEARAELGLQVPVMIGLAKKRTRSLPYYALPPVRALGAARAVKPERVFREGEQTAVVLKEGSEGLHLLERIRDEAHRFAINFHRHKRTKRTFESALDRIPGVGEKRKLDLLRAYGSVKKIMASSPEEIQERTGIPLGMGKRILLLLSNQKNAP